MLIASTIHIGGEFAYGLFIVAALIAFLVLSFAVVSIVYEIAYRFSPRFRKRLDAFYASVLDHDDDDEEG